MEQHQVVRLQVLWFQIRKVAQRLEGRNDNQASYPARVCSSSTEDLSWVEDMAAGVGASSPPSTATNESRSFGEVVLPISVKQQLRRTILAKSSQRMCQRDVSLSDGRMIMKLSVTTFGVLF